MFYDEIWAKKKCKDLKLDRLGYSCKDLENQSDENTEPYMVNRASQSEYIIVVKNKTDKNLLIKVRGVDKELLIEEAMKKCTDKHKEGCYVELCHNGNGKHIEVLEKAMRLSEDVIRYLTVKQNGPLPTPRATTTSDSNGDKEDKEEEQG